ncbi:MAG: hypothetical protein KatS3mg111_0465 [Pirellulaceae bacterium]|nr:MAG: hypothetical protein KatS3mg111_0465 [Pirellulaceae bacterium]
MQSDRSIWWAAMIFGIVVGVVAFVAPWCCTVVAQDASLSKEVVLAELAQAQPKLLEFLDKRCFKYLFTTESFPPNKPVDVFEGIRSSCFCLSEQLIKVEKRMKDERLEAHTIEILNPEYEASVVGARKKYHLSDVVERERPNHSLDIPHDTNLWPLGAGFIFMEACSFENIAHGSRGLNDAFFEVSSVSTVTEGNGEEFVRIEGLYQVGGNELRPAWMLVSPNEDWVIRRAWWDVDPDYYVEFHGEYQLIDGRRVPKKFVETWRYHDGKKLISRSTIDVLEVTPCDCNPEEFYLTAYGLPEPGRDWGRLVFNLGLLVFGIVLLVLTVRKLRRRR